MAFLAVLAMKIVYFFADEVFTGRCNLTGQFRKLMNESFVLLDLGNVKGAIIGP
jgi:hypothetical protein